MMGEIREKDPDWVPVTPAKGDSARTARKYTRLARRVSSESSRLCGKSDSKNAAIADNLKKRSRGEADALDRNPPRARGRMKRHRPKVFDESRPVKKPVNPSTPKPRTPKPARHVKKRVDPFEDDDDEGEGNRECSKRSCGRKLDFDEEICMVDQKDLKPRDGKLRSSNRIASLRERGTVESPKIFKKRRMMRRRMSLDKLIRLVRMIHQKSMCECVSTVLDLTWMNLKRKRSKRLTRRGDSSSSPAARVDVQDERCEHPRDDVVDIQDAAAKTSFEHCKHPHDDDVVVSVQQVAAAESVEHRKHPQDDVVSHNGYVQNCSSESGDCTCGAETDKLERSLESDASFQQLEDIMCEFMDLSSEEKNVLAIQDDALKKAFVKYVTRRMKSLRIGDGSSLVVREQNGRVVLVPSEEKINRKPKVDLDDETKTVWNMLMGKDAGEAAEEKGVDEEHWKKKRELLNRIIDSFIARIPQILGHRRFSRWKGSVVDSVVGVFLTQNVSDHLSSSAFMALAARYPPPSVSEQSNCDDRVDYVIREPQQVGIDEAGGKESNHDNQVEVDVENGNKASSPAEATLRRRKGKLKNEQENTTNWDDLRKEYSSGISAERGDHNADSVNWEAVRQASLGELAEVIVDRGMNYQLAGRIKNFLDRLVREHGGIDLEWLRDVPPDKAKNYLKSIVGLGLKSTECVRLLALLQPAFPIDVNVGRVVVRLGWVPLQPLPFPMHLLNDYPALDEVQKYLWPRICHRDQLTLYELHCYLLVLAKAFCTKTKPNCNACPMRANCKHYASELASSRPSLESSPAENMAFDSSIASSSQESTANGSPPMLPDSDGGASEDRYDSRSCEPIIEFPASPEPASVEPLGGDIEDLGCESGIPTIILNSKELSPSCVDADHDISKFLGALTPQLALPPMPKLKHVERLRTVHHVYELPDSHPLLAGFEKREPEDPNPYLLAIWTADESTDSSQESKRACNCQESTACEAGTGSSGEVVPYQRGQTVQGTILIPSRTATRGSFPLNGTYFQINEVFADHESSRRPIDVPREWIWNLRRRVLYCGTSITSICRGLYLAIQACSRTKSHAASEEASCVIEDLMSKQGQQELWQRDSMSAKPEKSVNE